MKFFAYSLVMKKDTETNYKNMKEKFPLLVYDYKKYTNKLKFLEKFAFYDCSSDTLKKFFIFDFLLHQNGEDLSRMKFPRGNIIFPLEDKKENFQCSDTNILQTIKMYKKFYKITKGKNCSDFFKKISKLIFCDSERESMVKIENGKREISVSEFTCLSFINKCEEKANFENFHTFCEDKLSSLIPPIGLIRNYVTINKNFEEKSLNIIDDNCYYNKNKTEDLNNSFNEENMQNLIITKYFDIKLNFTNEYKIREYFKNNLENFKSYHVMTDVHYERNKKNLTNLLISLMINKTFYEEGENSLKWGEAFFRKYLSFLVDFSIMKRDFIAKNKQHEIHSGQIFFYIFTNFFSFDTNFENFFGFLQSSKEINMWLFSTSNSEPDKYFEVKLY